MANQYTGIKQPMYELDELTSLKDTDYVLINSKDAQNKPKLAKTKVSNFVTTLNSTDNGFIRKIGYCYAPTPINANDGQRTTLKGCITGSNTGDGLMTLTINRKLTRTNHFIYTFTHWASYHGRYAFDLVQNASYNTLFYDSEPTKLVFRQYIVPKHHSWGNVGFTVIIYEFDPL
jgi:hypothetical protein